MLVLVQVLHWNEVAKLRVRFQSLVLGVDQVADFNAFLIDLLICLVRVKRATIVVLRVYLNLQV